MFLMCTASRNLLFFWLQPVFHWAEPVGDTKQRAFFRELLKRLKGFSVPFCWSFQRVKRICSTHFSRSSLRLVMGVRTRLDSVSASESKTRGNLERTRRINLNETKITFL
uniref:Secreted protein n=1 Tax=Nothobranchius furzeri TaxID=105023 RepID=A0A1A8VH20_NOTFU